MPTCVGKARLVKKAIGAGLKCGGGSGVVSVAVWVMSLCGVEPWEARMEGPKRERRVRRVVRCIVGVWYSDYGERVSDIFRISML